MGKYTALLAILGYQAFTVRAYPLGLLEIVKAPALSTSGTAEHDGVLRAHMRD